MVLWKTMSLHATTKNSKYPTTWTNLSSNYTSSSSTLLMDVPTTLAEICTKPTQSSASQTKSLIEQLLSSQHSFVESSQRWKSSESLCKGSELCVLKLSSRCQKVIWAAMIKLRVLRSMKRRKKLRNSCNLWEVKMALKKLWPLPYANQMLSSPAGKWTTRLSVTCTRTLSLRWSTKNLSGWLLLC